MQSKKLNVYKFQITRNNSGFHSIFKRKKKLVFLLFINRFLVKYKRFILSSVSLTNSVYCTKHSVCHVSKHNIFSLKKKIFFWDHVNLWSSIVKVYCIKLVTWCSRREKRILEVFLHLFSLLFFIFIISNNIVKINFTCSIFVIVEKTNLILVKYFYSKFYLFILVSFFDFFKFVYYLF